MVFHALLLLAACGTPTDPVANPDDGAWPDRPDLDAELIAQMERAKLPGLAACTFQDGAVSWCQGYGWANLEDDVLVTPDTPFLLASVSKLYTAVATMRAVEDGYLGLDDPVNDHLPFALSHPMAPNQDITPRMLMTHTGGIDDNWDVMEPLYTQGDSGYALADFMFDYFDPSGRHYDDYWNFTEEAPGEEASYSNIGTALMAYVVQCATGQDFAAWTDAELIVPLGFEATSWWLADLDQDTLAMPYDWQSVKREWKPYGHYGFPDYPSGQLRTGAESLARFLSLFPGEGTVDGTRVLEQATVDEMMTVQYPDLDDTQGLFVFGYEIDGEELWGQRRGRIGLGHRRLLRPHDERRRRGGHEQRGQERHPGPADGAVDERGWIAGIDFEPPS